MDTSTPGNTPQTLTPKQALENTENVRDLFARAHDYIAQAQYQGHMGMKVAEVLNFLKFHHDDFKLRAENMAKQLAQTVDVEAAKAATDAVLVEKPVQPQTQSAETVNE